MSTYNDEDDDTNCDGYTPGAPKCNDDLVRDLMNYNPTGALCQVFVVHAIQTMCAQVKSGAPGGANPAEGMIDREAWARCATHIEKTMNAFYGRH